MFGKKVEILIGMLLLVSVAFVDARYRELKKLSEPVAQVVSNHSVVQLRSLLLKTQHIDIDRVKIVLKNDDSIDHTDIDLFIDRLEHKVFQIGQALEFNHSIEGMTEQDLIAMKSKAEEAIRLLTLYKSPLSVEALRAFGRLPQPGRPVRPVLAHLGDRPQPTITIPQQQQEEFTSLESIAREPIRHGELVPLQNRSQVNNPAKECFKALSNLNSEEALKQAIELKDAIRDGEVLTANIHTNSSTGASLLHQAIIAYATQPTASGRAVIETLLEIPGILVNFQTKMGKTPLHYACAYIHVKGMNGVVGKLLAKGADPKIADQKGYDAERQLGSHYYQKIRSTIDKAEQSKFDDQVGKIITKIKQSFNK